MEVFHGAHFVRLRSRVRRSMYLAAEDDGWGVGLAGQRAAHNTVWAVEHAAGAGQGGPFVLLRGAYGRYLLATDLQAAIGPSHGVAAVQHAHADRPAPPGMMWQAHRRGRSFVLRNTTGRYLRANGRYLRWRTAVTVAGDNASSMMQWAIEVVPRRLGRPTLLDPPAQLIRRRNPPTEGEVTRIIRYVQSDVNGHIDEQDWRTIQVNTNNLIQVRLTLANHLGQNRNALHTTLCVRAGYFPRLSPLLIDLPIGNDCIDIVVISHGTPADDELRYPFVDA